MYLVKGGVGPAGAAEADDLGGAHAPHPVRHVDTDVAGAQNGELVVPDGADGELVAPAPVPYDFLVLRHPPQQHQCHHDDVFGDGDAVDVGVGEHAVGIGENGRILAVGVHTRKGAAVPLQSGGSGTQQLGGVGVQHLAVLHAGLGFLELVEGEEVGDEARFFGGFLDLGLVGVRQKFLINTNVTAHRLDLL